MRQFKVNDELINKIKKLINNDSKDKLINILDELHYADLAEIFESLEIIEVIFLVKIFDKEKIADALAEIDEDKLPVEYGGSDYTPLGMSSEEIAVSKFNLLPITFFKHS